MQRYWTRALQAPAQLREARLALEPVGKVPRGLAGTRTQRIRTAAEIPFETALLETAEPPLYQRIAPKAMRLWELGLSLSRIARHLGVTDKTVGKSLGRGRLPSRLHQSLDNA